MPIAEIAELARAYDILCVVDGKGRINTAEADTEREALFFAESAEMLRVLHAASPVSGLLGDSRVAVAKAKDGSAIALAPIDR